MLSIRLRLLLALAIIVVVLSAVGVNAQSVALVTAAPPPPPTTTNKTPAPQPPPQQTSQPQPTQPSGGGGGGGQGAPDTTTPDRTGTVVAAALGTQTAAAAETRYAIQAQATLCAAQTAVAQGTLAAGTAVVNSEHDIAAANQATFAARTAAAQSTYTSTPQPTTTAAPAAAPILTGAPPSVTSDVKGIAIVGSMGILILAGLAVLGGVGFSLFRQRGLATSPLRPSPNRGGVGGGVSQPPPSPASTAQTRTAAAPSKLMVTSTQSPVKPTPARTVTSAPVQPPPAVSAGQLLHGRYVIHSPIGRGGMGTVHRAHDQQLNRWVALKERMPDPNAPPQAIAQAREQFWREAQVLANLTHPNLPRVTDYFSAGGREYLAMDFVEGQSLDKVVQQRGKLAEAVVIPWANQLLDALSHIHARNVIHRDIKPQNIILAPDGRVMLVDFGLVKLLDPNDPRTLSILHGLGTVDYAPLEQYAGGQYHTDARSDIYSFGATLYFLVAGRPPEEVHRRILNPLALTKPRALNANLSLHFEAAILRAIEIHPEDRFQSANEMRTAL